MDNLVIILLVMGQACDVYSSTWVKEMENKNLWQGDILLDPDEHQHGQSHNYGASIKGGKWPGGKIPYTIGSDIGTQGKGAILKAIDNYHKDTCIRFHKRTNEDSYILFYKGETCFSPIGYRHGRVNKISLAEGCWYTGTVMHEIGHSLGLYHEQSRPDRDKYVRILWDNIIPEAKPDFEKSFTAEESDSFGTPYDYESMMHYSSYAFALGNKMTIRTIDPSKQRLLGNQLGFSKIDKAHLGMMYNEICRIGGRICQDVKKNCMFWASRGYCDSQGLEEWMSDNCCRSCKGKELEDTKLLGCFSQSQQPLQSSTLLFSERNDIKWDETGFKDFVNRLLMRCRDDARSNGYAYFSIRFYAECYGGNDKTAMLEVSADKSLHSTRCISGNGKYTNHCGVPFQQTCVGIAGFDSVYLIVN